ncbi:MAG TPA: MFS transporter [Dehalococcoidia bacterium]|nr:MFS transporter [Dehalococcoidia bacterium]
MRGMFYGWKLVGLALLVIGLASGPIWSGVGVWVKALEMHFGWSRAQLTGAFSLAQLEGSIVGPFLGYLIDRLGPRRMVFAGLVITGLGFILFSRTNNLLTFYLSFGLIMLGSASGSWLPFMTAINRWFIRKRGMAMAVAAEGSPLGGLLLLPILAWAVTPSHFGWSTTALWIGIVFLAMAFPMSWLIRERPEDYGERPDGGPPPNPRMGERDAAGTAPSIIRGTDQPDFTASQAIRTSAFWLITFGQACSSLLFATLTVHLVPMLTDQGLSLQSAASVFSMMMGVAAVFQLIGGYVGDRMETRVAVAIFAFIQAAGFIMAVFAQNMPMAILFAVLFGAGFGGRNPLTVAIRAEYFGPNAFATITGISSAPMYLFMLAAPLFAAFMFDTQGSYMIAWLILGALGSMSGVLFLLAKKPS